MNSAARPSYATTMATPSGFSWSGWQKDDRPELVAGHWAELKILLHPMAHDRALLLCEAKPGEWAVWVPDLGEAIVSADHLGLVCHE